MTTDTSKVTVHMVSSLDGFIAKKDGSVYGLNRLTIKSLLPMEKKNRSCLLFSKIYFFYNLYRNPPYICFTIYILMEKNYLGEFEELVLTMVAVLREDAYGNALVKEIKSQLEREVNLSAVHITLYRLEDKGFVKSEMGGATSSRGGRRKRYFKMTNSGLSLIHELQEQKLKLWKLLPQLKFSAV